MQKTNELKSTIASAKPVAFELAENLPFTIKSIEIDKDKIYKDNLTLNFELVIDKDNKTRHGQLATRLFVFYKAVDNKGKDIPGVVSVATNYNKEKLTKGKSLTVSGQLGSLDLLENFAKLQIISKEEYELLK